MRRVALRLVLAVAAVMFGAGVGAAPVAPAPLDPKDGYLFEPAHARELLSQCRAVPGPVQDTWRPSPEQIRDLELQLPKALASALKEAHDPPPDYRGITRQYGGFVIGGRRLIYVSGSQYQDRGKPSKTPAEIEIIMKTKVLVVCDGGSTFFGATYDPQTKTFVHFDFNGLA